MVDEVDASGRDECSSAVAAGVAPASQRPAATPHARALKGIAASVVAGVSLVACGTQTFGSTSNDKGAAHPASASALLGPAAPEVSGSPGWPNGIGSTPPPQSVVKLAEHLLTLVKLPSGAVRQSSAPAGRGDALSAAADEPATPDLLDLHQFYLLSGSPQTALAWLQTHLPTGARIVEQGEGGSAGGTTSGTVVVSPPVMASPGSTSDRTGSGSGSGSSGSAGVSSSSSGSRTKTSSSSPPTPPTLPRGVIPTPAPVPSPAPLTQVTTWWIGYGWPAAHGMNSEGLSVELVSAGHDKTAVRVDSQVTWILPRPASEVIPSGARTLTVSFVRPLAEPVAGGPSGVASGSASSGPATASSSGSPGSAPSKVPAGKSTTVTVTNLSKIRAIAAAIDALPLFPAGAMSCPMDNGEAMVLTFGSGHGGQPLAVVSVGTSGCDATAVTIGGKVQPALAGGELAVVVARALGLPIALLGGSVTAMPPVAGGTVPTSSPAG